MADGGRESSGVRLTCAILESQSAIEAIKRAASLAKNVIEISIQ
jgi:DNA-binding transcriptional MocR family regulator